MATKDLGRAVAGCNYVANDEIWKDHVHQEVSAMKKWPASWGFMKQSYKDLVKDDIVIKERKKRELPTPIRLPPITPIEKYIHVYPSPKPFPVTTARAIGWRSAQPSLALEIYGPYAKPKGGLIKQLNWPQEGID